MTLESVCVCVCGVDQNRSGENLNIFDDWEKVNKNKSHGNWCYFFSGVFDSILFFFRSFQIKPKALYLECVVEIRFSMII